MTGKMLMLLGLAVALSSSPAMAVDISNLKGQSCSETINWHFINNNSETTVKGKLHAEWSSGDVCDVIASKALKGGTQHFDCSAEGELLLAYTNLPGKLVLSSAICEITKCIPDPKGELCDGIDNTCEGTIDEGCKP